MPPQLYIAKSGSRNAPTLPLEAVTRTFGIYGQRGTGKTNTAVVLVEEMVRKGGHVVVLDPVGAWWGITHDGEGKGLPGVVIGGEHADVPLEETGGALVADLVVARHWPVVVIDMKLLRKGAQRRFLADFLEDLYLHNRQALHVVFEEADTALPQSPRGMDPTLGRVLGAAEDIVKYGRGRGLGASLVSQRFATVNANVREQVETLILMRLMGPLDQKAAKGWIQTNGDLSRTAQVLGSMASLERGEGWLYSPGWLDVLERVRMKYRRTFDSSATPEVGQAPAEPGKRAPVDIEALRTQMAETVERAKANDPKALRARIAELERQVAERPAAEPERVEVPVLPRERFDALEGIARDIADSHTRLLERVSEPYERFQEAAAQMRAELAAAVERAAPSIAKMGQQGVPVSKVLAQAQHAARRVPTTSAAPAAPAPSQNGDEPLRKAERAILAVLAQYPQGRTLVQLGILAGYSAKGGGFRNALGALRSRGYISAAGVEPISPTPEGLACAAAEGVEPLPTGRDLLDHWLRTLPKAHREILTVLYECYPQALTPEEIAARTPSQYEPSGGGFRNALGKLRTLELADGRGAVRAAEAFFV